MNGPEYKRSRLLCGAELIRRAKISSVRDLAVSFWKQKTEHVIEVLNLETGQSARRTLASPLDVPSYGELVEAVMTRCRV